MTVKTRRLGPIGTTTRLLGAAALLYLAFFDGASWGLEWYDLAVGLGALPAAMIAFGLRRPALCERPCSLHRVRGNDRELPRAHRARGQPVHGRRRGALLRDDAHRQCLAGTARLRGHRAREPDPRPRRPGRLPALLADRRGRGTPQRTKVGERTTAATGSLVDGEHVTQPTRLDCTTARRQAGWRLDRRPSDSTRQVLWALGFAGLGASWRVSRSSPHAVNGAKLACLRGRHS
jgi:hypothetical protein